MIKGDAGWYHIDQLERDTYDQKQAQKEVDRWIQDIDYLQGSENRLSTIAHREPLDEDHQPATDPTASDLAYSRDKLEAAEIQLQHTPAVDYLKTRDELGNMGFIIIDEDTPVQLKSEDNRHPWKVGDSAKMTAPTGPHFFGTVTKVTYPDGNLTFTSTGGTSFPLSEGAFRAGYNLEHIDRRDLPIHNTIVSGSDIWRRRLPDASSPTTEVTHVDNFIGKGNTLDPLFYEYLENWPTEWSEILSDPEHPFTQKYFDKDALLQLFPAQGPEIKLFSEGIFNILHSDLKDSVQKRLEDYFKKNMWTQAYSRRQISAYSPRIMNAEPKKPNQYVDVPYIQYPIQQVRVLLHNFVPTPTADFALSNCLAVARINRGCFGVLWRLLLKDQLQTNPIGPHYVLADIAVADMTRNECERWIVSYENDADSNEQARAAVNRRLQDLLEEAGDQYVPNMETAPEEPPKKSMAELMAAIAHESELYRNDPLRQEVEAKRLEKLKRPRLSPSPSESEDLPILEDEQGFAVGAGGTAYDPPEEDSDEEDDDDVPPDAAIRNRPKRKAASDGTDRLRQRRLRDEYNDLCKKFGHSFYDLSHLEFADEIDVRIRFVATELLNMDQPLRNLWTTTGALDSKSEHTSRTKLLNTVEEIFNTTSETSPWPWRKITRVLEMPEHNVFPQPFDVFQLNSKIKDFNPKAHVTFEEVANFYRREVTGDGDPSIRQDLSNYLEGIIRHAELRRKRMLEVAARIAYNDFVTQNPWLGQQPFSIEMRLENEPPALSDVELTLFECYNTKPPEPEPKVVEKVVERIVIIPAEVEEPPASIPAPVPSPAIVVTYQDAPKNKGWLVAIALALTFAFLAKGLND